MLLEPSKEELKLKRKTYELINNSIQTTDKAVGSLAFSVTYLSESIKDGLALLAQSFAQNSSVTYGRPINNLPPNPASPLPHGPFIFNKQYSTR